MSDDPHVIDKGWDALPQYSDKDGDDAVTVSISTAPGEWLVNTKDSVVVPMSMAEVVEALRAGKLTERSLVWRHGMQEWAHVETVPQLRLAARLPARATPTATPLAAPPPRPAKALAPARASSPAAAPTPPHGPAPHQLSRRSTLPMGLPAPSAPRPTPSTPLLPTLSPAQRDEPEVLAVYARPAATISFDLSPEQPLRAPTPPAPPLQPSRSAALSTPETLAPLASDSAPRPRYSELSVVAAADFRAIQQSGKRRVVLWSLGSAAAASLLTFLVARTEPAPMAAVVVAAAQESAPAAVVVSTPQPSAAPVASAEPAPAAESASVDAAAAPAVAASALSKEAPRKLSKPQARRRKPAAVTPAPTPEPATVATSSSSDSAEPNPYDVKLEEMPEAPAAKPTLAHGSGLEEPSVAEAASADGSSLPGF